ncbi:O-methyltransferase [Sulfobacillus thermosulfidooxidans]|uniref:O-methyltransferase n=1 Tax=Sulfobacillus thermosulfidooxidans TaxID=28034 RepID=UPI0006B58411|nr:class I SAM-dependent methyltransferase [Sulfobacillus thermosulfidooxidans]
MDNTPPGSNKPEIVLQALYVAQQLAFSGSCLDEVGKLLALLAGHIRTGKIAEIGTGCGVGTAWLISAATVDVFTVDHDISRVNRVRQLFAHHSGVHVLAGDWTQILSHGPFQLIFVDAKPAKYAGIDAIISACAEGGLIFLDDLTPFELWPEAWKNKRDPLRDMWLNHSQLWSVEIRTSARHAAILARRTK